MEQKLTKSQSKILIYLAEEKEKCKKEFEELAQSEQEQVEMLIKYYELPSGQYGLKIDGEDLILYVVEDLKETKEKKEKPDKEK